MLKKFFAIIAETYREAIARKTIVGFFIFSTVLIILTLFFFLNPSIRDGMRRYKDIAGPSSQSNVAMDIVKVQVIDIFWGVVTLVLYYVTVSLGIFSTTGFITSQMEKGTIDLLLSKPVPRWLYVIGRYIGSLSIIVLQTMWFIVGIWLVVSITMGSWDTNFLSGIFFISLGFAGIYSIVVLISVISGSTPLSIIGGIGLFTISLIVAAGRGVEKLVQTSGKTVWGYIGDVLYYILPQGGEMASNMKNASMGKPVDIIPVFIIIGVTAVYLLIAVTWFSKKEF